MDESTKTAVMSIQMQSSAFEDGGMIPRQYTCDGADISPGLQWAAIPEETRSLALIADDPDAPSGTFVHWVLYGLSAERHELTENMPKDKHCPTAPARASTISAGSATAASARPAARTGITSRSTPVLDTDLDLPPGESKAALLDAMEGHILAKGQIMGRYKRQRGH